MHAQLLPHVYREAYISYMRGIKGLLRGTWLSVFNFRERWKYEIKTRELWLVTVTLRGVACKDRAKLEIGPKIANFETLSE